MKLSQLSTRCVLALCMAFLAGHALADIAELPREIVELAKLSGDITRQIRTTEGMDMSPPCDGCTDFQIFYASDSSWAVVTKTPQDKCFAVFSDSATVIDWTENLNPGTSTYCGKDNNGELGCCQMRQGFKIAFSSIRYKMEGALRECAESCDDPDDCVVLGGYSQGAATSQIAAIYFRDLNPYVIGLAPPQTIFADCPLVSSDRTYGFVNSHSNGKDGGLVYDLVPIIPGVGAKPLGKLFLLSNDDTGMTYLGQDSLPEEYLKGPVAIDVHLLESEGIEGEGYLRHIGDILDALGSDDSIVRTTGFSAGFTCNYNFECKGECDSNRWSRCID